VDTQVLVLGIMVIAAAVMIVHSLWPKQINSEETVRRRITGAPRKSESDLTRRPKDSFATSMLEKAAPFLSRPVMPKNETEQFTLKTRLANAGIRRESAPLLFLASKTICAVVGGLFAGFLAVSSGKELGYLIGQAALGAGTGFMLPNVWLWLAVRQRSENIRNGLPDSLDLMVVSVEAGLGLDAGIQRVGDEMRLVYPELSEELQISTIETQMGVPRGDALSRMAERAGVVELRALVAVITQAERLGTSVAKALRNQAEALRTKRRQAAEERAQKTAVKLLLPLVLFIFPAILIVLGGPAGIKLAQTMSAGSGGALMGN
jgi:tight adherence protein C